ncbi:MAG: hypothetical protein HY704_00625 [Gemmatimonadetes bacterium]|nr:hypothetical protein [Gemmatimonadota bacterium]
MQDRIAALRALATGRPGDAIVRYALGVELRRRGETAAALEALTEAIRIEPDYTAAYVEAGEIHAAEGRPNSAREIWLRGIAAAERKGASRTRLHVQRLLAALERSSPTSASAPAAQAAHTADAAGALPSAMRPRDAAHVSRPVELRRRPPPG